MRIIITEEKKHKMGELVEGALHNLGRLMSCIEGLGQNMNEREPEVIYDSHPAKWRHPMDVQRQYPENMNHVDGRGYDHRESGYRENGYNERGYNERRRGGYREMDY